MIDICSIKSCISFDSYIKPQLRKESYLKTYCCISFDSYIKPQRGGGKPHMNVVVYLLIPTSNHNLADITEALDKVVYLLIPTSNHNL